MPTLVSDYGFYLHYILLPGSYRKQDRKIRKTEDQRFILGTGGRKNSGAIHPVTISPFGSEAAPATAMIVANKSDQDLLALDGAVDVPNKEEGCAETDGA